MQEEECLLGRYKQTKQDELDSKVLDEPMDIYHPYTFCAVFWIAGIAEWQEKECVCAYGALAQLPTGGMALGLFISIGSEITDAGSAAKATKLVHIGGVRSF